MFHLLRVLLIRGLVITALGLPYRPATQATTYQSAT